MADERMDADQRQALKELLASRRPGAPEFEDLSEACDGRPSSARYVSPRCRITQPGHGGAPLSARCAGRGPRPSSAPTVSGERWARTADGVRGERYREIGVERWPFHPGQQRNAACSMRTDRTEVAPVRQSCTSQQEHWGGQLWSRSLRQPGFAVHDPVHADVGSANLRELHKQWRDFGGPRPPYSGTTTWGRTAQRRVKDDGLWVMKPVSAGKLAQDHLYGGGRYLFNAGDRKLFFDPEVLGEMD